MADLRVSDGVGGVALVADTHRAMAGDPCAGDPCAGDPCSGLVRPLGFEPRTCGLRVRCSAIELEAPAAETYGSSPRDTDESSASPGTEGDRRGSNPRPPGSQPGALTN